jgi:hypothetical protein
MTDEELIATYPAYTVYVMHDENGDVESAHTSTFYAERGYSYADCCVAIGKMKYFIETQDKYLFWAVTEIEKSKSNHLRLDDIKSNLTEIYNMLEDVIDDISYDEEEEC